MGFYIPENGILHSHRRENLKYYINITILHITHRSIFQLGFNISETVASLRVEPIRFAPLDRT
jgi:hypothetical protein